MKSLQIAINKQDRIYIDSRKKLIIETPNRCIVCQGENLGIGSRKEIKTTDTKLIFYIDNECVSKLYKQLT